MFINFEVEYLCEKCIKIFNLDTKKVYNKFRSMYCACCNNNNNYMYEVDRENCFNAIKKWTEEI